MPGRFVYWMNVSLDLMIESVDGETGAGQWPRIDEQLHREFNARARGLSAMVQGRVVYEMMETFWPAVAVDPSRPDYLREYGQIWTAMPKILLSRTRTRTTTTTTLNTRVVGEGALEQLAALRASADGDIGVGGANVATQLLAAGLLDELMLFTHPVVLGGGRPLFDGHPPRVELDLLEHQSFASGVTLHRYAVRPPG